MEDLVLKIEYAQKNRFRLVSGDKTLLGFIVSKFSMPNPGYRFSKYADKILHTVSPTYTFKPGLTFDIIGVVKEYNSNIKIVIDPKIKDILVPFSFNPEKLVQLENENYIFRDYQEDAIRQALKFGRGIINNATGAGKSAVIYGIIKNIWHNFNSSLRTLVLVPNIQLVSQMYKDFLDYGCDEKHVCMFSSFSRQLADTPIIVSNRQWLEEHSSELPKDIELIMIDECHGLKKANKVSKFVASLNTSKIFGFTGTVPNDKIEYWDLLGICGKVLSVKRPYELQQEGYLAETKIITIRLCHSVKQPAPPPEITDRLERAKLIYPLEWRYCENNKNANTIICKLVYSLNGNSILLYDHIEHGYKLLEIMKSLGDSKKLFLIDGSTPVEYREDVRSRMENEDNCLLLANTACFKLGINIKNIINIAFAFTSGKSSVKILQSIGRGLRKKENKIRMNLLDFYHSFKYSTNHFSERLKLYKDSYQLDKIIFKSMEV